MQIHVSGNASIIGAKVGQGDSRRAIFIAPWGCFLDAPKPAPEGFVSKPGDYTVDAGPAAHLIREALTDSNHALSGSVSIIEEKDASKDELKAELKSPGKGTPKF